MPTRIRPVDSDVHEFLQGLIRATYLDGQCYELAIALHRALHWELVGLIQDIDGESVVRHACVRHPDGGLFDARGRVTEEEFIVPFGAGQIITYAIEYELHHSCRPITERAITQAGKLAMSMWPELPWSSDTYIRSVKAFLDDLEGVCKRHGFWLRGDQSLATWPVIAVGEGDELGYEMAVIGNGNYAVNRVIK